MRRRQCKNSLQITLWAALGIIASSSLAFSGPTTAPNSDNQQECHVDGTCSHHNNDNTIMGLASANPTTSGHQHQQHHKETSNNTMKDREGGLKQFSKGTDSEGEQEEESEDNSNSGKLLKWLSDKMVPDAKSCGVFLAPSTIPGAGLGMFAGRTYKRGDVVTEGDIIIPLSELDWHNGFSLDFFLWEEYTWSDSSFPHMTEENGYQSGMQGCSPGIGAAINCDLPLVNVVDTWSKISTSGLHRSKDPGAGSFTPYHDRKSRASRTIRAGEELYIDYGENYFETREYIYGLMPMHRHYKEANSFVKHYLEFREKALKNVPKHLREDLEADLWGVITDWGFETRMFNALPKNHSDLEEIMEMGGTEWQNYKRSTQDIEWLEQNGQCMDNIKPGKSTIAQAGRGAFATRLIPKGGLVAPAPLIHIKNKDELIMYDVLPENKDGLVHRNASRPIHHQLLLNYCFGHRNSTLLFSPYGLLTSLINHSPTQANTRIVWTSSKMRSPEWLQMSPDQWTPTAHHSGLQFDFVALRDIEANEEILIDYGPEWEAAWKEHVSKWETPAGADKYMVSYEMQKQLDADVPTEDEGGIGEHLQVYCHETFRQVNGLEASNDDYHRCRAVKRYKSPKGETLYLVELYYVYDDEWQSSIVVTELLFDVPRSIFHFEDTSYTRDHQQTFSFRHEMMIPDDIFPEAWMNRGVSN